MLDKLTVSKRLANLDYSTFRASALAVCADRGCLDCISLNCHFSSFSLSLEDDSI